MYLEKLQIQGFKSFANKNTLVFPGMLSKSRRGITAIVGPNGSGKSNVADAVRWALGEQSMKTLRGKKGEDVIFSGSDKKAGLGMSEVSLYLNNADKKAAVDYSQIVLTRRLFRNGDSEYLINNSKVRLLDIQMMLAKANFGQKTYSVIGQGMVEGFLNISLSERKEFFDEATGVKQFQIKRDDSLNKLRSSYENLNQAQMLLFEIEPRLKSLTRQVNKLHKRDEIEKQLKEFQLKYYSQIWHEINNKFSNYNKQFLEIEQIKRDREKKLDKLNRELSRIQTNNKNFSQLADLQQQLTEAQSYKDTLTKQLAKIEAQIEIKLEANGQFDLSWLNNKKGELAQKLEAILEEINLLNKNIEPEKEKLESLQQKKERTKQQIGQMNRQLASAGAGMDDKTIQLIYKKIKNSLAKLEQAKQESDVNKVKMILDEIKNELNYILSQTEESEVNFNLEQIQQEIINLTQDEEKIATQLNETNLRITARSERVKLLKEKQDDLESELTDIETKLKQQGKPASAEEQAEIKQKIERVSQKIINIKKQAAQINSNEEVVRDKLFALQKDMQNLQNEINDFNNQLNELKINSARYETKLEDLEIEIRQQRGSLKKIKEYRAKEIINQDNAMEQINQLKRQLDLIGGIDPEIEKEYKETNERYDFLSGQVNDLAKAIDSLEQIIKELDLTIKKKFDKEFKIILTKFEEYFKILFNGGKAKIIKVMDEEITDNPAISLCSNGAGRKQITEKLDTHNSEHSESNKNNHNEITDIKKIKFLQKHNATGLAGIEIQATPPGKKIKTISMLSGGERALTAIALICAIISANPSPFVVLDEVDAALDEANSERFAKILDDLSHKTQFIVITHNRATMRRANILYGITMRDNGVSKLLSIKLDDAKEVSNN